MSVLQEVFEWSTTQPAWQRDALRRLAISGNLGDTDIEELTQFCLQPYLEDSEIGTATPLAARHLDASGEQTSPTQLLGISDVKNVNALVPGSSLPIAPSGLTVVYGGNGTGKTGYVRILRQVCRARGESGPVLPNVYEQEDEEIPAKATITFQVGDDEHRVNWIEGGSTPGDLQAVSIFDRKSAAVYVSDRQEVAYLPYGLDLLPRLASACGDVRERLEERIEKLERQALPLPDVPKNSKAAEFLSCIRREDAREKLEKLTDLSDKERERLTNLDRHLSAEKPSQRAAELEARSDRIGTLGREIESALEGVSPETIGNLKEKYEALENAKEAADHAAREAFGEEPLEGTGSDPWRELWSAARRFSQEVARIEEPYPPKEGEPCLLCQRELNETTADRMARFESYVKSEIEERVSEAKDKLAELASEIEALSVPSVEGVVGDLELEDESLVSRVREVITGLEARLEAVQEADKAEDLKTLPDHPDSSLIIEMAHLGALIQERSSEQKAAAEDEKRKKLENERDELRGKIILAEREADLNDELDRIGKIQALEQAKNDTDTTSITMRSKRLTTEAVTDVISSRFEREVEKLRLGHLPIRVAGSRGERGSAYHRMRLEAPGRSGPGRVLSRGEHRCVALAAFLAELSVQESRSTVVLDDPVSSLDHDRREHVADRLVQIASERPVVVFTHDLVFLFALNRLAGDSDIDLNPLRLERADKAVGRVVDNWPWAGMTLSQRVGKLRQLHQNAGAVYRDGRKDEYESMAREIYGFLREAWERGVEEVLLNKAVERFDRVVQTRRLRSLPKIEERHVEAVNEGMTKTSRYLRGHDDAVPTMDPIPEPDELKSDIDQLDEWRREVHDLHH